MKPTSSPREPDVLIVAGSFDAQGGLQRRLSELAGSLARDRSVTVLTWVARARPRNELRANGIRVVVVPSLLDWRRDHHPVAAAINTAVSVATGVTAALVLRRRWSVACAAGLHPEGTVAALAAWRHRSFVVTTWLVGPLGNAERLRRSICRRAVLRLLRRARWLVPQTIDSAQELIELGLPAGRVKVVSAGVDLRRFRPAPEPDRRLRLDGTHRNVAVYAGRFDLRQKRLDLLLDAWRAAALTDWELMLAGAGDDEPTVRRRAAEQGSVRVLGWQDDVASLLASADLFLLPTVAETNALAMLEGMACGLPGIVSATDGLSARRPDGVLLAENQVAAWVRALHEIDAVGPDHRRATGARARAWVEAHADSARSHALWAELL